VQAPLLLRTAPLPRETLPSFLSRLAAVNGVGAADFAVDLGFSIKRFLNLEEDAVQALAGAGGLDAAEVAEILSWTGSGVGDVRMEFRSEVFVSRALRNPRMRGCPVCLREDARGQERTPARAMALRGDWQLREVGLCVRHSHPMVTLWEVGTPVHRYEVAARLDEVAERVLADCRADDDRRRASRALGALHGCRHVRHDRQGADGGMRTPEPADRA
jgi:hypothetical protein